MLKAAEALFEKAQIEPARLASATRLPLVIDPLVDGMSGVQTAATRTIGARLAALIAARHPRYEVRRFSNANLELNPLVLLGTLTSVNAEGKPEGKRASYRVWLTLVDLSTERIVGKGRSLALMDGVDATPTGAFRDAPAWTADPATMAYIDACQKSHLGDSIPLAYSERIRVAALIAEAIEQYESNQYQKSLGTYVKALHVAEGNQLRVHTGVYLNHWKLSDRERAQAAFARVVDFGLEHRLLAMKFEFRPGSAAWVDGDKGLAAHYPMWLTTIAKKVANTDQCLDLIGHTSPTGPEPLNERLSLRRAEFVRARLARETPVLGGRMITSGAGSSANMVGTARDNDSDALDRRVELKLVPDCKQRQ